jgi:beta-1,4-mannosyltransferase
MTDNSHEKKEKKKHVVVVVLGDIGRSPRMQYHTLSLLEHGHYVTLIGYVGEGLIPALEKPFPDDNENVAVAYHKNLRVLRMKPHLPSRRNNNIMGRLFYYPLRLASLLYCLVYTLWVQLNDTTTISIPVDVILVQNPPSVPTLLLVYFYCVWEGMLGRRRPRFVIDWHNLGKKISW